MRFSVLVFSAAFALISSVGGQSFAQDATPAETSNTPAASQTASQSQETGVQDPDEEVVCRWVETETGSRLRRARSRICATRTQWEIMADESRDTVNDITRTVQGARE